MSGILRQFLSVVEWNSMGVDAVKIWLWVQVVVPVGCVACGKLINLSELCLLICRTGQ